MPHFFNHRDRLGLAPGVWIIAVSLFLLPLAVWSLRDLRPIPDVEHWLPESSQPLQTLDWSEGHFPVGERLIVSWDSSSLSDPRVERLLETIRGRVDERGVARGGISHVSTAVAPVAVLRSMQEQGVEPREAARRLAGSLLGTGPLRVRLTVAGRQALRRTRVDLIEAARRELGIGLELFDGNPNLRADAQIPAQPSEDAAEALPTDPAVINPAGQLIEQASVEHDLSATWTGMMPGSAQTELVAQWLLNYRQKTSAGTDGAVVEACFYVIGSPVAIVATLSGAGEADRFAAQEAIRAAALSAGVPAAELRLAGGGVVQVELDRALRAAVWDRSEPWYQLHLRSLVITAALVVLVLMFLIVQEPGLATLVILVSSLSGLFSLALVPLLGGSNGLTLALMPPLVVCCTLAASLQVLSIWRQACEHEPSTALVTTFRAAALPCFLSSVTIAAGLAGLGLGPLQPVAQFGWQAAAGMGVSLLLVLLGLPALLQLLPTAITSGTNMGSGSPGAGSGRSGGPANRGDHSLWRSYASAIVQQPGWRLCCCLLIAGVAITGLMWFQTDQREVRQFREHSRVMQDARAVESHLAGVFPVEVLVRFDVDAQQECNLLDRMEMVRLLGDRLRAHPQITGCLSLADYQPVTEPLPADASFLVTSKYNRRAQSLQQKIRDQEISGAGNYYGFAELAEIGPNGLLNEAGDELWRVSLQVALMSSADDQAILSEIDRVTSGVLHLRPGAQHVVTGSLPVSFATRQVAMTGLTQSFALAMGCLVVAFVGLLRSVPAGLAAVLPVVLPLAMVLGLHGWIGQRLDSATLLVASIALGIGTIGGLHFLAAFRRAMAQSDSRQAAVQMAVVQSGPALLQICLTLAVAAGVLATADLLLISKAGLMLAQLAVATLLNQGVMLPLLLSSRLGQWFEPGPHRSTPPQEHRDDTPAEPQATRPVVHQPHLNYSSLTSPQRAELILSALTTPNMGTPNTAALWEPDSTAEVTDSVSTQRTGSPVTVSGSMTGDSSYGPASGGDQSRNDPARPEVPAPHVRNRVPRPGSGD